MANHQMRLLALFGACLMLLSCAAAARPGRGLLDQPCCEDCDTQYQGDDQGRFYCYYNCQDCVEGSACLQLSQDVAGKIAEVACEYAMSQCNIQVPQTMAFQVPREQCYTAAGNACNTYGEQYQMSGQGDCQYWSTGGGDCSDQQFQQYATGKLREQCDSVAKGIAISLP